MAGLARGRMIGVAGVFLIALSGVAQDPVATSAVRKVVSMEYPMLARMARLEGTVSLSATILSDGTVGKVTVLSGPEPLSTPAREDLSRWLFESCRSSDGACVVNVIFSFVLRGTCTDSPRCPTEFQVDLPNRVLVT